MQFRVPQNIAMEDRIVGPLTAIQFGICVVGFGCAFLTYSSPLIPAPINQAGGIAVALLTALLAVGKFNDQPLYRFLRFAVAFLITPKVRVWHKVGFDVQVVKPTEKRSSDQVRRPVKNVSKETIARLADVLDTRGSSGSVPSVQVSHHGKESDGA